LSLSHKEGSPNKSPLAEQDPVFLYFLYCQEIFNENSAIQEFSLIAAVDIKDKRGRRSGIGQFN
jgi:hypothetical protein